MDLESAGEIFNVKKLKEKLQKRYPNYNFDVPPYLIGSAKHQSYVRTKIKSGTQTVREIFTVDKGTS